jgi:TolA-binding protein
VETKANPVVPRAAAPASAAELLEQANRARRGGSSATALSLFRELTQRYPSSAEARLAEVRLGSMLLEKGQARAALTEFDRHLSRGGGLAPEALYGKARAFSALGDTAGERAAWTALLRDYPGSPYVGSAERRLEALDGRSSKTK